MKQAFHIFRKDVRYLRWEIALAMAVFAGFAVAGLNPRLGRFGTGRQPSMLLALTWAFLCARLVQAEAIPGDRQFWITRPYDWRSLMGAKLPDQTLWTEEYDLRIDFPDGT